jgi:hypothetical protein
VKRLILAVLFLCGALSPIASASQSINAPASLDFEAPYAPPGHVSSWIGIIWIGPQTVPIVPVYYSTQHRQPPDGVVSRYIYLSPQEYRALRSYTYSSRCSRDKSPHPTIVIREYSKQSMRDLCMPSQKDGCEYLFGLARLASVDWSHKDTYPLWQFESVLAAGSP